MKGLIAHELSHVEQYSEQNIFLRCYNSFINFLRINCFPKIRNAEYINKIEKDADYRAIKNGYGDELILLVKFEESKNIKLKNDYLTIAKIRKLMKSV